MIERVLVVDDEPLARKRVRDLLRRIAPEVSTCEADSGPTAIAALRDTAPQAVFLDVELPGCSGLEVVRTIGVEAMPPTVFVTAYDEHALAAFDASAIDYLLKPFDAARLERAWNRLSERHAARTLADEARSLHRLLDALMHKEKPNAFLDERLIAKEGDRTVAVPLGEVSWIESSGNYVILHAPGRKYRVRETLSSLERRLDPSRFVRVHRRFIVDLTTMLELRPWSGGDQVIVLRGGAKLPVSRNYRRRLARRLEEG